MRARARQQSSTAVKRHSAFWNVDQLLVVASAARYDFTRIGVIVCRKRKKRPMETQTETRRTELIEMVRLSQRTVDYATKAHESGRVEYAQHACFGRDKLVCLNKMICCATLAMGKSV